MPVIEYLIPEGNGPQRGLLHLFACSGKDNVYADIHIAKTGLDAGDESLLRDILTRVHIVSVDLADSLDHFQAGSAPYLRGEYSQAISHYEQALALEQISPRLDKSLWGLLIGNLGTAYGLTGDLLRAKTVFEYGLSRDPADPVIHYDLARIYAAMDDRARAMPSLHNAFHHALHRKTGQPLPDPRRDPVFARCMWDPEFRTSAEALMQPAI